MGSIAVENKGLFHRYDDLIQLLRKWYFLYESNPNFYEKREGISGGPFFMVSKGQLDALFYH